MVLIRRMTVEDIPVSKELLAQLGYLMDTQEFRRRYDAVARCGDHAVMGRRSRRAHHRALPHLWSPGSGQATGGGCAGAGRG